MFLETLKLIVDSGEQALLEACDLSVVSSSLSQMKQGQVTFPSLARIAYQGGTLQELRLGADTHFCRYLAEMNSGKSLQTGIEKLAQVFLKHSLQGMSGRYPRGAVEDLQVGPQPVFTRGTRSFGVKFKTPVGHLYFLAEVPSRLELELAKGSEFHQSLISTYLPKNWVTREELAGSVEIDNLLVLLRKTEADIMFELVGEDGQVQMQSGLLLEQCSVEKNRALRVNLNLETGLLDKLSPGDKVSCFVGVQDRSLELELPFLGCEDFSVSGETTLSSVFFGLPERVGITQRRRAFRIDLINPLPVEIEVMGDDCTTTMWFGDEKLGSGVTAQLVDLSFSGARVVGPKDTLCPVFPENGRLRLRIFFPDSVQPLQVIGLVRRSTSKLSERDVHQDELGVEFLISPEIDRHSIDAIRQYVLREQRSWLARRVHVAG